MAQLIIGHLKNYIKLLALKKMISSGNEIFDLLE